MIILTLELGIGIGIGWTEKYSIGICKNNTDPQSLLIMKYKL